MGSRLGLEVGWGANLVKLGVVPQPLGPAAHQLHLRGDQCSLLRSALAALAAAASAAAARLSRALQRRRAFCQQQHLGRRLGLGSGSVVVRERIRSRVRVRVRVRVSGQGQGQG